MRPHLADRNYTLSPLNRAPSIVDRATGDLVHAARPHLCIYAAGLGAQQAPLDDPDWNVWALNLVPPLDHRGRLRADLWWDIHQRRAQTVDDLRWIRKCPVPIVVPNDLMDAGPNTVAVPDGVRSHFPNAPFACTFAYQIAAALLAGFRTIGLFGVELAYGTERERTVEWACVSWWVGYCEADGVEIVRPEGSRLGRHPYLYGLDYEAEKRNTERYLDFVHGVSEAIAG